MTALWVLGAVVALGVIIRIVFEREVKACFERDPAARNLIEVLLTYSGLHAIICHRVAHALDRLKIPVLPGSPTGGRWRGTSAPCSR